MSATRLLETWRDAIEAFLDGALPREEAPPRALHAAMRHGVLSGGKRLRPLLCLAAAQAVGGQAERVLRPAAALELLHAYSLIHDDLPAMDDDALRRGRPTCHVAFGEAIAILAGDALLTLAFAWMAAPWPEDPSRVAGLVRELAQAAGHEGMVAGQVYDLEAEGRPADQAHLERIHSHKTGALIRAALRIGALAAGAGERELAALTVYGEQIGLAFQVVDDLLNVTADEKTLGKPVGSDARRAKATYPGLMGTERTRELARVLHGRALEALATLTTDTEPLVLLARAVVDRDR